MCAHVQLSRRKRWKKRAACVGYRHNFGSSSVPTVGRSLSGRNGEAQPFSAPSLSFYWIVPSELTFGVVARHAEKNTPTKTSRRYYDIHFRDIIYACGFCSMSRSVTYFRSHCCLRTLLFVDHKKRYVAISEQS